MRGITQQAQPRFFRPNCLGITSILLAIGILFGKQQLCAAAYYWEGSTSTDWSTASNWKLSGGTAATVAPGAGDQLFFDGQSTRNCELTTVTTVDSIVVDSSFTDTLTVSANLTCTGGYHQSGGVVQVQTGWFKLQSHFLLDDGQFNHISGKIQFEDLTEVRGELTAQFLQFYSTSSSCTQTNIVDDIHVLQQMRYAGTGCVWLDGAAVYCNGDITLVNTGSNGGGNATIKMTGNQVDHILWCTKAEGESRLPNVHIEKSDGDVILKGDISVTGDWIVREGVGIGDPESKVIFYGDGNEIECGDYSDFFDMFVFNDLKLGDSHTKHVRNSVLLIDGTIELGSGKLDLSNGLLYLLSNATTAISYSTGGISKSNTDLFNGSVIQSIRVNTGTFTYPFLSSGGTQLEVDLDVTTAGTLDPGKPNKSAVIAVSTYETDAQQTPNNEPEPWLIKEFQNQPNENSTSIVDRFWSVSFGDGYIDGYLTYPQYKLTMRYTDGELGGNNSITEADLDVQNIITSTPAVVTATVNTTTNSITTTATLNDDCLLILTDESDLVDHIVYELALSVASKTDHPDYRSKGCIELVASGGVAPYSVEWSDYDLDQVAEEEEILPFLTGGFGSLDQTTEDGIIGNLRNELKRFGLAEGSYSYTLMDARANAIQGEIVLGSSELMSFTDGLELSKSDLVKTINDDTWETGLAYFSAAVDTPDSAQIQYVEREPLGDEKLIGFRTIGTLLEADISSPPVSIPVGHGTEQYYYLHLSNGTIYKWEATGSVSIGTAVDGDVLSVMKADGDIIYLKNNQELARTNIGGVVSDPLYMIARLKDIGTVLNSLKGVLY